MCTFSSKPEEAIESKGKKTFPELRICLQSKTAPEESLLPGRRQMEAPVSHWVITVAVFMFLPQELVCKDTG